MLTQGERPDSPGPRDRGCGATRSRGPAPREGSGLRRGEARAQADSPNTHTTRGTTQMMTEAPAELNSIRLCRARTTLHALVRGMLAGSGVEIREREKELVISNPRDPDKGRIYINYTTGEVSWQRPVWEYFGRLQGYSQSPEADPDTEPTADVQTIIRALCGRDGDEVSGGDEVS